MPHDLTMRETLGRLYLLSGQDALGLKQLSAVAKARARVGDYLEAIRLSNEILAADPSRTEVALYLARLYAQAPELAHRAGLSATVAAPEAPAGALGQPLAGAQKADHSEPEDAASLVAVHAPEDVGMEKEPSAAIPLPKLSPPRDPIAPSTMSLNIEDAEIIVESGEFLSLAPLDADPEAVTQVRRRPASQDPRTQALMEQIRSDDEFQALSLDDDDEADFSDVSRAVLPDEEGSGNTMVDGLGGLLSEGEPQPDPRSLPDIPLLSSLPHRAFVELMALAELRAAMAGEVLVREGESGDAIYIVISGKVRVHTGAGARMVVLAELGPGAFFGEIALLSGKVRRATVTAAAPTEVFVIQKGTLDRLRQRYPVVDHTLERFYETRLVARFLAVSPLFHSLPVDVRESLASRFHPRRLAPGEVLCRAGDVVDGLYIICEGRVTVRRGDHPFAVLGEGDLLGVVASLKHAPVRASVLADTQCMLQLLDKADLEQVLTRWPDVHQAFVDMAARRVKALES